MLRAKRRSLVGSVSVLCKMAQVVVVILGIKNKLRFMIFDRRIQFHTSQYTLVGVSAVPVCVCSLLLLLYVVLLSVNISKNSNLIVLLTTIKASPSQER
jgi:hypothetical protein